MAAVGALYKTGMRNFVGMQDTQREQPLRSLDPSGRDCHHRSRHRRCTAKCSRHLSGGFSASQILLMDGRWVLVWLQTSLIRCMHAPANVQQRLTEGRGRPAASATDWHTCVKYRGPCSSTRVEHASEFQRLQPQNQRSVKKPRSPPGRRRGQATEERRAHPR